MKATLLVTVNAIEIDEARVVAKEKAEDLGIPVSKLEIPKAKIVEKGILFDLNDVVRAYEDKLGGRDAITMVFSDAEYYVVKHDKALWAAIAGKLA